MRELAGEWERGRNGLQRGRQLDRSLWSLACGLKRLAKAEKLLLPGQAENVQLTFILAVWRWAERKRERESTYCCYYRWRHFPKTIETFYDSIGHTFHTLTHYRRCALIQRQSSEDKENKRNLCYGNESASGSHRALPTPDSHCNL